MQPFTFSWKVIVTLIILTALAVGFSFLYEIGNSIGGGSMGKDDWIFVGIVSLPLLVSPLIYIGTKTWWSSKSALITIRNILIALTIQIVPYAVLASVAWFRYQTGMKEWRLEEAAMNDSIIAKYTEISAPSFPATNNWNVYRGTSLDKGYSYPFIISYPTAWSKQVGQLGILYIGNEEIEITISDRVSTDKDQTTTDILALYLEAPLNGYPVNRSQAQLSTYKVGTVSVYRAQESYSPVESREALIFIKDDTVYQVSAVINSSSEFQHASNMENVRLSLDSLRFE